LTGTSNLTRVEPMGKRLFFVAALLALFLVQVGDCAAAMNLDPASMRCCHSMPCTPANHSQGCCKRMKSAQAPSILPAQHVSLHSPSVASVEYPRLTEILGHPPDPSLVVEAQQHSPPDLYTLHASLLI